MPSHEPETKKARTRQRIVESAARALRRVGFDGVGVAEVMSDAGLTHGGFYAHFSSREALLAEALDQGASESLGLFEGSDKGTGKGTGKAGLKALIDTYLSDAHAENPEAGCTLAALGSETRRQSPEVRRVATRRLTQVLGLLEQQLEGSTAERRDKAMTLMATLVGSLVLARLVDDAALGRAFRAAAKRLLRSII